jgi:anaerobic C4-dicarboxylate transporter
MDPTLFNLDYAKVTEVLVAIVFLSLLIERALSLLFESRVFIDLTEDGKVVMKLKGLTENDKNSSKLQKQTKKRGIKEVISFLVSFVVCWYTHFDAVTITFTSDETTQLYGYVITAMVIAGGGKGSIKLFKDWLGFKSSYEEKRIEITSNPK